MNYEQIRRSIKLKESTPYKVKGGIDMIVKDVDTSNRIVSGVFSTINFFDSDKDVMLPGVFDESISKAGPAASSGPYIKHLLFHDMTRIPGKIQVLEVKDVGGYQSLYFETKMSDTPEGDETLQKYAEGIYDNHSIGLFYKDIFYTEKGDQLYQSIISQIVNSDEVDEVGYFFGVKNIELLEGSTVAFGSNRLTPALGVKSKDKGVIISTLVDKVDRLNSLIKNGKVSDEGGELIELEIRQIKQMIMEMEYNSEDDLKRENNFVSSYFKASAIN